MKSCKNDQHLDKLVTQLTEKSKEVWEAAMIDLLAYGYQGPMKFEYNKKKRIFTVSYEPVMPPHTAINIEVFRG